MGYRIHYATTYKVKYDGGTFSHSTELNETLADLCPNLWSNDECSHQASDELEIPKSDFPIAFEKLKELQEKLDKGIDGREDWMKESDYTWNDIRDFLQEALDNADADNDFVRFSWF